jgi:hypothetical protein
MCRNCFLEAVQNQCNSATITALRAALNTPLIATTTSFLGVLFTQTNPGAICALPAFDSKQSTKSNYHKEAKKIVNTAISLKQLALRNEVLAEIPDAGIGQRFMTEVNKDDRDLDRVCRLLQAGPLKNEVCVAACWSPVQWDIGPPKIIFSTNKCEGELGTTDKEMKKVILAFFATYTPPPPEHQYSAEQKEGFKNDHHERLPAAYSESMQKYLKARDLAKLNRGGSRVLAALKSGNFYVVKTASEDVHAEIRALEYIDWYSREYELLENVKLPIPLYIGVSLLCCSKCVAFFFLYRSCNARLFLPSSRGQHGIMDSNWQPPPRLTALIQHSPLIEKIVLCSLPPSDLAPGIGKHMTEDLSDSDSDDY